MSDFLSDIFGHTKVIVTISVYALTSFCIAALLTNVVPESYYMALIIGWILSILIMGKIVKSRFLSPQPA